MTIYFISGHTDLTEQEFNLLYRNIIIEATTNPDNKFVMGNAPGVDFMAQKLLIEILGNDAYNRITVFHRGNDPGTIADPKLKTKGGFKSHNEKDAAMTMISDIDIAFVRSFEESKKLYGEKFNSNRISGTQKNILRRQKLKK
ncbi:hypothetical protein QJ854_gp454 [Moumouvirus goulette]|uniref:Uncharacterized protein n=1 Tax=Moumouvirus goulette TaxID=1247379 RepID=M1PH16_9VIRU|nr:hypothetical protein QJ854_gp454 [Moumouvirus goulette]AGF85328.1 hypothetical protein glt_00519 [Moumouvirus goulette]